MLLAQRNVGARRMRPHDCAADAQHQSLMTAGTGFLRCMTVNPYETIGGPQTQGASGVRKKTVA